MAGKSAAMVRFIYATIAVAALVGIVSRKDGPAPVPTAAASAQSEIALNAPQKPVQAQRLGNGYAETILKRSSDGHFYADLSVNGTVIHFLVDTGATSIALTREDAARAGLTVNEGEFTARAKTASGEVGVKPITLSRVSLDQLEATDVEAAIVERGLSISLLGQSWLKNVGHVTIEDDQMVLR